MEATLLESVFPTDTNPRGTLFGGQLVAWMDKAAGIAALRQARNLVVTAHIENIDFRIPIHVGELVELKAKVVSVGRTSMRVEVSVYREGPYGTDRQLCTVGRFTMVALDENGTPTPVPPLADAEDA
jgi:acyl-CoA hydrolase